ncbi:MAG: aminotransferase class I/II-fold pyridoxal phosphate-dependent enzyme [Phycisphaerales bacterium]|nr:aminotransferase class I/II-fold pyridoxal phosphate-dependent enzyme [Phycisphaerales bacterium]
MDAERLIAARARGVDASAIRRVFNLARTLKDPINLSIGQPDFPVPEPIRAAAKLAIDEGHNGYTVTQGIERLRARIAAHLNADLGWTIGEGADEPALLVTSGTSGALTLAAMALLDPGDEIVFGDPYFPLYPAMGVFNGAKPVMVDTHPDFRLTRARVSLALTDRTKAVLLNTPGNPTGAVASHDDCKGLLDLCRERGVLLISDEIYDEFTFEEGRTERSPGGAMRMPSPARQPGSWRNMLLVRGFGKTYGVTGWRLGYAAGPRAIIEQMAKIQQFTFVNAPSVAQWGCAAALDVDMAPMVAEFQARRDLVLASLRDVTEIEVPHGAFYAYPHVPPGMTGQSFAEACLARNVLLLPGAAFSGRDEHVRISFAAPRDRLAAGLEVLRELFTGS